MMTYTQIIKRFRDNWLIRTILLPIILLKRKIDHDRYIKSEDAKYIRTLRNINKGKRCFVIGNGPSLNVHDLDMLNDEITFACNRIYDIFPYTDWRPTYYMCADKDFAIDILLHRPDLSSLSQSELFFTNRELVCSLKDDFKIHEIFQGGKFRVNASSRKMETVSEDVSNHFSGAQSVTCPMMELAIYMGISEIYLLGVDHNFRIEIDSNGHKIVNSDVHQLHFKEQIEAGPTPFYYKESLTKCYGVIRKYADQHGISIKNATRGGMLEVFERVDFDSLFPQRKQIDDCRVEEVGSVSWNQNT